MKNKILLSAIAACFLLAASSLWAQKLSVGFLSGITMAKPVGNFAMGKWEAKQGPTEGLFVNYRLTKVFSLQTEINYAVVNYMHKNYNNLYYSPYPYPMYIDKLGYNSINPQYYADENYSYSFFRIPLYVKFNTLTKLKLEMALGGYLSFRDKYDNPDYSYAYPYFGCELCDIAYSYYGIANTPPKYDAGLFYSAGLSYPLTDKFTVNLTGRYFSGKRTYIESYEAKNGVSEIIFGLAYTGFGKKQPELGLKKCDSIFNKLSITVKNGVVVSKNAGSTEKIYSNAVGYGNGLSLLYAFSKNFGIRAEILYERKGYSLKGKNNSYFINQPGKDNTIDTRVSLDYASIPLLLDVRFGKKLNVYFDAGAYVAMLVNARCKGTDYYSNINDYNYQEYKRNIKDDINAYFKPNDWGWILGGGVQYPIFKKYKIGLEVQYNAGQKTVYAENNFYPQTVKDGEKIRNQSLTYSFNIQVPFK